MLIITENTLLIGALNQGENKTASTNLSIFLCGRIFLFEEFFCRPMT